MADEHVRLLPPGGIHADPRTDIARALTNMRGDLLSNARRRVVDVERAITTHADLDAK
jgi:hypothetical protein